MSGDGERSEEPGELRVLYAAFAMTLGLSAGLLFMVQPLVGRLLLPILGGVPAVWNTCMVFFQVVLLAGYLYAHYVTRIRSQGLQLLVHIGLLMLPWLVLPMQLPGASLAGVTPQHEPTRWALLALLLMAGLPFFVLSTTSPLLQRWFSRTRHKAADNPYMLYAASNLGSIGALLGYPLLLEPLWGVPALTHGYAVGYGLLSVAIVASGALALRMRAPGASTPQPPSARDAAVRSEPGEAPSWRRRAAWVGWAFIPSSLMLGVTTFVTSEIASGPLLWVIPLAIYLVTMILTFGRWRVRLSHSATRIMCLLTTFLMVSILVESLHPVWLLMLCHAAVLLLAGLLAHGELAADAPEVKHLTAFYLWVSVGGALGGMFNTFIAPALFDRIWEYPLMLAVICALRRPRPGEPPGLSRVDVGYAASVLVMSALIVWGSDHFGVGDHPLTALLTWGVPALLCYHAVERPRRFGLALVGLLLVGAWLYQGPRGEALVTSRTFFGVLRVSDDPGREFRVLFHGSTDHGRQRISARDRCEPLQYYSERGPAAQVMARTGDAARVAVVGLGAGSLVCYARPSQPWTFFEIDPEVLRLASDPQYFTFLKHAHAARVEHVIGDARLELEARTSVRYELLVIDAFSGDAVPMHLLTLEAFSLYMARLSEDGVLALHISNRFLELERVIAPIALHLGLSGLVRYDVSVSAEAQRDGHSPSVWLVLSRSPAALDGLPGWKPLRDVEAGAHHWTDAHQRLWDAL